MKAAVALLGMVHDVLVRWMVYCKRCCLKRVVLCTDLLRAIMLGTEKETWAEILSVLIV
jgi:hypothetical protein